MVCVSVFFVCYVGGVAVDWFASIISRFLLPREFFYEKNKSGVTHN